MNRIQPFRCGYGGAKGYTCAGIPSLAEVFHTSAMYFDSATYSSFPDAEGGDLSSLRELLTEHPEALKNYYNLPQKFKETITSLSPLVDIGDVTPTAPEERCSVDLNPFNSTTVMGTDKALSYSSKPGQLDYYATYKAYVKCNGVAATNCADYTGKDSEFEPGILRPMIDTDFSPINVQVVTAMDSMLDGLMLAMSNMNSWRMNLNTAMDAISASTGYDPALRKMLQDEEDEGECAAFSIRRDDTSVWYENSDTLHQNPQYYYICDGGSAMICGKPYSVSALTGLKPPFTVYANISCSSSGASATLSTTSGGDAHVVIGRVTKECSKDYYLGTGATRAEYCYYNVKQDTCSVSADGLGCCLKNQVDWDEACMEVDTTGAKPKVKINKDCMLTSLVDCEGFVYSEMQEDGTYKLVCYPPAQC